MTAQDAGAPSPELIFETFNAYQRSAALSAAIELDLFRAVGQGPGDLASLARQCASSERGIRILCDYLTVVGLLAKQDGHYRHTPSSAMFLDPRSPACIASAARFLCHQYHAEPFARLAQAVRSGHTVLPGGGSVEPDNPIWVDFATGMAPMTGVLVGPLAAVVLDGLAGPLQVLDIAAGHGLFGIEVAKLHPEAAITAVEYGGPYDIVLLTNFLHHFDRPTCVSLLRKVRAAMKPGGRAAALEFVPDEDRVSPPVAAAFSLTMLAHTVGGDAYTFRELEKMYQAAGFDNITRHPVPRSAHTVVMGRA
jgi:hypothetical protein